MSSTLATIGVFGIGWRVWLQRRLTGSFVTPAGFVLTRAALGVQVRRVEKPRPLAKNVAV